MTGQVDHNLGEFSVSDTNRGGLGVPMTAQSARKRPSVPGNDLILKRMHTGQTNDLGEDSIIAFNDRIKD